MTDETLDDTAFRNGHFPVIRCRLYQHHACGRAAFAHVILRLTNATAAAGAEAAPRAFARQALAGGRVFGSNLCPVAFEFLSEQLREPRQRALAHLGAGDANDDSVIWFYNDPGIDFGNVDLRFCILDKRDMKADDEAAGSRR